MFSKNQEEARSYINDKQFGLANELPVIEKLTIHFENEVVKSKGGYCNYDAEDSSSIYEIKSRRCSSKTYATTIIPVKKTLIDTKNKRLVFVFAFSDGLYYIVYHKELFTTFQIKNIHTYRNGIIELPLPHYFIPVDLLTKINI